MAENTSTDLASTMQCGECGKVMPRGGHRLLYCEPCKTIVRRRHARTRAAVKRVPKVHNPDFKAAWALTNLQPLWALDNIRKHNRMTFLL